MSTHSKQRCSPFQAVKSIYINRKLIAKLSSREIASRYKGSVIGLGWAIFNPVLMLAVYTFVFSVVFKARWGIEGGESRVDFALLMFTGLTLHGLLAEVLNRSPDLIIQNANYVKKVVFPIEILPIVTLLTALFHALISYFVLLLAFLAVNQVLHWTVILVPFIVIPLLLIVIGLSWMIASLGTFLRDIGQAVTIITLVMLFLAPVFYPLRAIPEQYHKFILSNPLTFIIEQMHKVTIFGTLPDWQGLALYTIVSMGVFSLGFRWFQKARNGFADVL